jgi:hypothetical protein
MHGRPSGILDTVVPATASSQRSTLAPALLVRQGMTRDYSRGPTSLEPAAPHRLRLPEPVGACSVCGVRFAASADRRALVEEVLRVHQSICPGGMRAGHVVAPFE